MSKTLLLADDSVVIQKLVGLSFANEDVTLVTTDNGDDAVARALETRPDLVLADVVMPGKNGYEVCEAIKKSPELSNVPVLLLTGTFEAFDEERARSVGSDGHITKPFEAQVLVDRVNELLSAPPVPLAPVGEAHPAAPAAVIETAAAASASVPSPGDSQSFDFFDHNAEQDLAAGASPPPVDPATSQSGAPGHDQTIAIIPDEAPGEAAVLGLDPLAAAMDKAAVATPAPTPDPLAAGTQPEPPSAEASVFDEPNPAQAAGARDLSTPTAVAEPPSIDLGLASAADAPPALDVAAPTDLPGALDLASTPAADAVPALDLGDTSGPQTPPVLDLDTASSPDLGASLSTDRGSGVDDGAGLDLGSAGAETVLADDLLTSPSPASLPDPAATVLADEFMTPSDDDPFLAPVALEGIELVAPGDDENDANATILAEDLFEVQPDLSPRTTLQPGDSGSALSHDAPVDALPDAIADPMADTMSNRSPGQSSDPLAGAEAPIEVETDLLAADPVAGGDDPLADLALAPTPDDSSTSPKISQSFKEAPTHPGPAQQASLGVAQMDDGATPALGTPGAGPDLSPMLRERLHETLEKVAWEAFADLSDSIVRQVVERVEQIAWEAIPQMAEALIREEIRRMKGDDE